MPEPSTTQPPGPRPYRMRRRLEAVEETRRRITAAAFELHASIGPSRTTISAIADRAGVQRHTVYAHFPDVDTLYAACTEHGIRVTGMPEAGPWMAIVDPEHRLSAGLAELFVWYRAHEAMLVNVLHDVDPTAPPPPSPDGFELRMETLFDALVAGWTVTDPSALSTVTAVIGHAMAFDTWRSLTSAGMTDAAAVDLMVTVVTGIAGGSIAVRHA
jgi:AcrR family transcriptional regulator